MSTSRIVFRIAYQIKEGDAVINMRATTDGLESLHKLLCGMDSFNTPLAQWHSVEIHELLENGNVALIPQAHLANLFDWQYGFNKRQDLVPALTLEEKEDEPLPYTAVTVTRRARKQPLLSTTSWWREKTNAY